MYSSCKKSIFDSITTATNCDLAAIFQKFIFVISLMRAPYLFTDRRKWLRKTFPPNISRLWLIYGRPWTEQSTSGDHYKTIPTEMRWICDILVPIQRRMKNTLPLSSLVASNINLPGRHSQAAARSLGFFIRHVTIFASAKPSFHLCIAHSTVIAAEWAVYMWY